MNYRETSTLEYLNIRIFDIRTKMNSSYTNTDNVLDFKFNSKSIRSYSNTITVHAEYKSFLKTCGQTQNLIRFPDQRI